MKLKIFACAALSLLVLHNAAAQQSKINGTVVDETGTPLPGATLLIESTGNYAITGEDGSFTLAANEGDIVQVAYFGYDDFTLTIGGGY